MRYGVKFFYMPHIEDSNLILLHDKHTEITKITIDTLSDALVQGRRLACSLIGIGCVFLGTCLTVLHPAFAESLPDVDLSIISSIESSGNPSAVGDGGKALGLYQLHVGPVLDLCRRKKVCFQHEEMFEPLKAKIVANWYANEEIPRLLKHFKQEDTLENRIIAWNAGIGTLSRNKPIPPITKKYIKRYKEMAHEKTLHVPGLFLHGLSNNKTMGVQEQGVSDVSVRV